MTDYSEQIGLGFGAITLMTEEVTDEGGLLGYWSTVTVNAMLQLPL